VNLQLRTKGWMRKMPVLSKIAWWKMCRSKMPVRGLRS
jgi:hypothetical protein